MISGSRRVLIHVMSHSRNQYCYSFPIFCWGISWLSGSVVDPDPVGSETFSRIRIQIGIRKNLSRFGTWQLRIWNEFSVKLLWKTDKICQFFSTKIFNLNIPFYNKKVPKKLLSCHSVQPYTLTRWEYKGKTYVKNTWKNSYTLLTPLSSRVCNLELAQTSYPS